LEVAETVRKNESPYGYKKPLPDNSMTSRIIGMWVWWGWELSLLENNSTKK